MKRIVTTIACMLALAGCIGSQREEPRPVPPPDPRLELLGHYVGTFTATSSLDPSRPTVAMDTPLDVELFADDGTWVQLRDPDNPSCPPIVLDVISDCDSGYACGVQTADATCITEVAVVTQHDSIAVWDGVSRMVVQEYATVVYSTGVTVDVSAYFDGYK